MFFKIMTSRVQLYNLNYLVAVLDQNLTDDCQAALLALSLLIPHRLRFTMVSVFMAFLHVCNVIKRKSTRIAKENEDEN